MGVFRVALLSLCLFWLSLAAVSRALPAANCGREYPVANTAQAYNAVLVQQNPYARCAVIRYKKQSTEYCRNLKKNPSRPLWEIYNFGALPRKPCPHDDENTCAAGHETDIKNAALCVLDSEEEWLDIWPQVTECDEPQCSSFTHPLCVNWNNRASCFLNFYQPYPFQCVAQVFFSQAYRSFRMYNAGKTLDKVKDCENFTLIANAFADYKEAVKFRCVSFSGQCYLTTIEICLQFQPPTAGQCFSTYGGSLNSGSMWQCGSQDTPAWREDGTVDCASETCKYVRYPKQDGECS